VYAYGACSDTDSLNATVDITYDVTLYYSAHDTPVNRATVNLPPLFDVESLKSHVDGFVPVPEPCRYKNEFFTPDGSITIRCGENTWTLSQYQQLGYDRGSTAQHAPSLETLVGWAKELLQLPALAY
jgi:hypothetical protein